MRHKIRKAIRSFLNELAVNRVWQVLVFVGFFAVIGAIYLIISHATPVPSDIQFVFPKNGASLEGSQAIDVTVKNVSNSTTGTLKIDGQAQPGRIVASRFGWLYQQPNGNYGFNFATLGVGKHTLQAGFLGVDSGGIAINNLSNVSIALPQNYVTYSRQVLVAASIQTSKPATSVKLIVDQSVQPQSLVATPYGWLYKNADDKYYVTLSPGKHTLVVEVNNNILSAPVTINVSDTLVTQILSPKNNDSVKSPLVVDARIDNPSPDNQLLVDGKSQQGTFVPTMYGWLFKVPDGSFNLSLSNGTHKLQVINGNTKSAVVSVTVGSRTVSSVPPPSAGAINGSRIGIATGSPYLDSHFNADQYYSKVKSLGVAWVRTDVSPCNYLDLTGGDNIVNEAKKNNLKLIITLDYIYCNNGSNGPFSAPKDPQAWANWAGSIVARWNQMAPGTVGAVEVWNEANNAAFWKPVDPAKYTDLLRRTYSQIKAKVPGMLVLSSGTAPAGGNGSAGSTSNPANPATFVQRLYDANGGTSKGLFDAVSHHPYETAVTNASNYYGFRATFWIRKVMNSHGDTNKQIWGTEAGWPSCYPSPGGDYMTEAQRDFRLKSDLKDWFYGVHDQTDGHTIGYAQQGDYNTAVFMIFRLYKNTNGGDPGYGLIYDYNTCNSGQANYSGTYEPPIVADLKNFTTSLEGVIPQ